MVAGVKLKRGERMMTGKAWGLIGPGEQVFKASLIKRLKIGDEIVAFFRVLPHPDSK